MQVPRVEDISDQFRDHLECPICFEIYNFPKLLPCQHTFCEHCLRGTILDEVSTHTTHGVHKFSFSCPVCRQETLPPQPDHSPDQWASLFPANLLAASLIESMPSLKANEDNYPRQQRSPRSFPVSSSVTDELRELPSSEYGCQESIALLKGIPSPSEIIDFESVAGIARCVKEGCLELKISEEANLEKLEVLKSISDLTSDEKCQLESLRSEILTRLGELNFLEDAICTTEILMETHSLEEERLELSSERMVIQSQLAEYEDQLQRLCKRAREASVNHVLENLKTSPSKPTEGDTNVEHQTKQPHCTSFIPITGNVPAQQGNGTWMPGFFATNQYPVLMCYPNQPTFPQQSGPCPSFLSIAEESSRAESNNQTSEGVNRGNNEKGTKSKISKWKKFFKSNS
ncbi:hypothetical protein CHS0354_021954 [Potamilus streckersoni]|uniref:RING-type domain-containing protein n=1 Tax=Potamilus streckersoni TaxID=2493646 RepID=A0AAE0SK73_9BIVA|nr:hypothetical protein CHS0354_021954 [Potamilus streckersoni]